MRALAAFVVPVLAGCSLIIDPPSGGPHPDIQINSITDGSQANVAVVFAGEHYFVVWQDSSATPPDTDSKAVRGRFVSKIGVPEAPEQLVNTTTAGSQDHPAVAALGTNMLVVWSDDSSGTAQIKGQVLSTQGNVIGTEIAINTIVAGVKADPRVIATADGFLVVWSDDGLTAPDTDQRAIRARSFDVSGVPRDSSDVIINTTTIGNQYEPQLARGGDGRILAVWTDAQAGDSGDIRGRMLDTAGHPVGDDFIVNTTTALIQEEPFALALADGGFLVAWTDGSASAVDTDGKALRARRFDANGVGRGDDFVLNARTQGDQGHPRLARVPEGSIFMSYEDGSMLAPDHSGNGVRARWLARDGSPIGDEVECNTYYPADQEDTALAVDSDGNVFVLWEDGGASPPDGSSDSVRGRLDPL